MPSLGEFVEAEFGIQQNDDLQRDTGNDTSISLDNDVATIYRNGTENLEKEEYNRVKELFDPGMKCEAKRLYPKDGESPYLKDGESPYPKDGESPYIEWVASIPEKVIGYTYGDNQEWSEYSMLLRTYGKMKLHSIVIQSPLLKTALKKIFDDYPGMFIGASDLEVEAPFKPFVHRWQEFVDTCKHNDNEETKNHLNLLLSALEPELEKTFAKINDFKTHGSIKWDDLWMIFNPGSFFFSNERGIERIYKLSRTEVSHRFFMLHGLYIDYDGNKFGHAVDLIAIEMFEGSVNSSDLGAYPLDSHPEKDAVVQRLVKRGRKFTSFTGVHYQAYDGLAGEQLEWVTGRIVIDTSESGLFLQSLLITPG
jgi:hypothetical protein